MTIASNVSRIIGQAGESATLRKATNSFNATTGVNTQTPTNYTVNAHVRSYTAREIAGLVQQGDREVRIAASDLSVAPEPQDKITIDSHTYTVQAVDCRIFAGVGVLYIMQVRG